MNESNRDRQFVEEGFTEVKTLQQELLELVEYAARGARNEEEARAALERAEHIKRELAERIPAIREKISPFEWLLSLREQYEREKRLLEQTGILVPLKKGGVGIKTIEVSAGRKSEVIEVPFPEISEVTARLKAANVREPGEPKGFIERKIDHGLIRLRMTPFGMPMLSLAKLYGEKLKEKARAHTLFYTKRDVSDPNEAAVPIPADQFNANKPVYIDDEYKAGGRGADVAGTIVYGQTAFDTEKHEGKTKADILLANPSQAWSITLAETFLNIPRAGNAQATGAGRVQIDTSGNQIKEYMADGQSAPSPSEYLAALQGKNPKNTIYRGERGQTPEEQLWEAIEHLLLTDEVLHDYQGNGSINYAVGAYFQKSGGVPGFCWSRDDSQAYLGWDDPGNRYGGCGVRPVAGV